LFTHEAHKGASAQPNDTRYTESTDEYQSERTTWTTWSNIVCSGLQCVRYQVLRCRTPLSFSVLPSFYFFRSLSLALSLSLPSFHLFLSFSCFALCTKARVNEFDQNMVQNVCHGCLLRCNPCLLAPLFPEMSANRIKTCFSLSV